MKVAFLAIFINLNLGDVSEIKNDDESDNSQDDSSHDFDSLDFYEAETLEYDRSQNEKLRDFYDGF